MASLLTGLMGLVVATLILLLIRRDRLHVSYGALWILVALGFALLGFVPGVLDRIAIVLGIGYPPVLGLSLGIILLVIKILIMDIDHSHARMRQQRLAQRLSFLEEELLALKASASLPTEDEETREADQTS